MMFRERLRLVALVTLLGLPVSSLLAQPAAQGEGGTKEAAAEKAAPPTHQVKAGPFSITVDLKGVLQPDRVATIAVEPKQLTSLKVVELAGQGTTVEKGDVILQLDTDPIDKQIRATEFAVKLAELALRQTEVEMELLEKTAPLDAKLAERTNKEAQEDLAYFLEVEKGLSKEQVARSLDSSEFQVEYANEELVQLKKMYEEDDLTEETEEMILRRTERSVENAKYALDMARIRAKRLLETSLPRQETEARDAAVRADLTYKRTKAAQPLAMEQKRIALLKQRYELEQSTKKFEELRADRELLTVRSPVNGVVYHGTWKNGVWSLPSAVKAALKVGGTLPAKTPVMTVVAPRPLSIQTMVEEKSIAMLTAGVSGEATPTAFPNTKLDVKVTGVTRFPIEPGKFAAKLALAQQNIAELVPGMSVAIKLKAYDKKQAITVPSKAVFDEKGEKVVYVEVGDDTEARPVKTGRSHGGQTEILSGLKAGESIRTAKP